MTNLMKLVLFALVLISSAFSSGYSFLVIYWATELAALQAILATWNQSTPNISTNLPGWSSTKQYPCFYDAWKGVLCVRYPITNSSNVMGIVVGLTLDDASMEGTLPPAISELTNLIILSLTRNPGLIGPIPGEIGTLSSLQILDLHSNNFNGSIPDLALGNLQELDLSGNQLTGQLPNFGAMKWLQTLKVSGNQLSGPSTPFLDTQGTVLQGLANLTALTTLDMSNNMFSGPPPDLTIMSTLEYLNLSMNNFNGHINPKLVFNQSASNMKALDLSSNNFSGPLPDISFFSASLQLLDFSYNAFNLLQVPTWLYRLDQLQSLALRQCGLIGSFPYQLASLPQLQNMSLDHNNFTGTLYIRNISSLNRRLSNGSVNGHLQFLSLTYNNISNVVYDSSDIINVTTIIMLENNPYCLSLQTDGQRCYCKQICLIQPSTNNRSIQKVIIISTLTSGITLGFVIAIIIYLFWRSKQKYHHQLLQLNEKFAEFEVQPTIFGYNELKVATRDFHPTMKLGEGGYGVVYKGIFANGVQVAIKQLFIKTQTTLDEFLNEVVSISGVKHRNLVKLKGCCLRDNKRLLVYEYLENGDLATLLFGQNDKEFLFWPTRFNICLGIARGLHYLHNISQPRIIHRDIKASNILLDKKLQPKIADFGLAILFPDDKSHISTLHFAGTQGYLAPEYATRGQLTTKVDVYSFGVLLLEIISGRKCIDHTLPPEDIYLVQKAWSLQNEGNLINIVDRFLRLLNDEVIQAQQLLNITLLCLLSDEEKRPSMARVLAMLQGEVESQVVEKDLELGRSTIELFKKSLSNIEFELNLSNIGEGSDCDALMSTKPSNANVNPISSSLSSIEFTCVQLNNS